MSSKIIRARFMIEPDIPEGLSVVITPSQPPDLDPGHCEIRSKDFSDKLRSKLARASTVLTESEIDLMMPGSIPNLINSQTQL